jgi:nicotinamide-nucleotide amidase
MLPIETLEHAARVLAQLRAQNDRVATAESCTGGLIAAALTHIAGSSDVVDRGFVTYSNEAKSDLLGVPPEMIAKHGAVSQQVARAMAEGALSRSLATVAVSVTGIAGPGGGTPEKPVGLVCFGLALRGAPTQTTQHIFPGDRAAVRAQTVEKALHMMERKNVLF